MGPLGTNPLKTPVAATFVNFLWPSTPPHANIRILAVAATHAGPNLFLGNLHMIILKFQWHHGGGGPIECGIFGSRWGPKLAFVTQMTTQF